jgi:opacity protein-like surface antigen
MKKKLCLLGLSSFILSATAGFAGVPSYPNAEDLSGFYLGIDGGGFYNTELDIPASVFPNAGHDNTPWGWTGSAFIGYQFNSNWSLQFGYILNQDQHLKKSSSPNSTNIKYTQYNMYIAAKVNVPLFDLFSGYLMIGPAYTNADTYADELVNLGTMRSSQSIWTPMGAIGLTYAITPYLGLSAQYMFIMQDLRSLTSQTASPDVMNVDANTQRVTFVISYLFTM